MSLQSLRSVLISCQLLNQAVCLILFILVLILDLLIGFDFACSLIHRPVLVLSDCLGFWICLLINTNISPINSLHVLVLSSLPSCKTIFKNYFIFKLFFLCTSFAFLNLNISTIKKKNAANVKNAFWKYG